MLASGSFWKPSVAADPGKNRSTTHRRGIVHVDSRVVGRSIVSSPLVGPLEFGSLEHLKFISDLPPLIDEVQVHHADCVILARKRAMMTLHCLLSTVFDPANYPSQH